MIATGEFERLGSSRTRRVDVRILSATNADIDAEVAAGRFRQDLLFRLNTIEIALPPLRDRRDDIPALAAHFLQQHARRYRKNVTGFDSAAMDALMRHPWPGNVRELEHAIERSVLMAAGSDGCARRSRPSSQRGWRAEPREHGARRRRGLPDSQSRDTLRQRDRSRKGARPQPQRAVSPPRALRHRDR